MEALIGLWRQQVADRGLEERLRGHLGGLADAGLDPDEAFLVAAKRVGSLDEAVAAVASTGRQEHPQHAAEQGGDTDKRSGRLGRWLRLAPEAGNVEAKTEFGVMAGFACGAAAAIKAPELFGLSLEHDTEVYARNLGLLVLPMLAGYFAWRRQLPRRTLVLLAAGFVALAVAVNAYPFERGGQNSDTEILAALHLPILLWLAVGVAPRRGPMAVPRQAHGLRALHRRVVHLLRADRARRRHLRRVHRGDLLGHRPRRRRVRGAVAGPLRRGRRGGGGRLAGRAPPGACWRGSRRC